MSIGCHSLWGVTNHIDSLRRSKRLAASISRFSAPHGVNQIALAIDGPREGAPCSLDVDGGFIDIPGPASLTSSLGSQVGGDERGNTGFPVSNRLMGELKAALQDHLRQITQTQLLPEPPEHDKQDDIGGIFQEVERGPRAFGEGASARRATESPIPKRSDLALFFCARGCAMRAVHGSLL